MIDTIGALLGEAHDRYFARLWQELRSETALTFRYREPVPHLSLWTGEVGDTEPVRRLLQRIADETPPLSFSTAGLGVFTGASPLLYITVADNQALTALQSRIYYEIDALAAHSTPVFHPDQWIPHLTVGWSEADGALEGALRRLAHRDFNLTARLDNIGVLFTDPEDEPFQLPLRDPGPESPTAGH